MQQLATKRGVPLHLHTVIYQLMDDLKDELSARLPPLTSHSILGKTRTCTWAPETPAPPCNPWCPPPRCPGEATVLATFDVSVGKKKVPVAGCRVQKGQLDRRLRFRLIRGQDTVWEGESSLGLTLDLEQAPADLCSSCRFSGHAEAAEGRCPDGPGGDGMRPVG